MSWCPKCRSEYVNGRTTCYDCGSVLVESLEDINDDAKSMFDFDSLSDDMKRRVLNEMRKENIDPRMVLTKPAQAGTPEFLAQIIQEENGISYEEYEKEVEEEQAQIEVAPAFVTKEYRLKDYRSSGYSFLIVGTLGLAFILLELFGVTGFFNFSGGSKYLFFTVMTAMFGGFIIIGIHSFLSSRKLKAEAAAEKEYLATLENWIADNVKAAQVNEGIDQSLSIEELYPLRSEKIRSMLLSYDESMDKSMLEHYVENTYIALFEA